VTQPTALDPDRLPPPAIASRTARATERAAANAPFASPADLLIFPDHGRATDRDGNRMKVR
jgi:hypothetical protein